MDEILVSAQQGNDDNFNLSAAHDSYAQINIDLKSLGVLDLAPTKELNPWDISASNSDEEFLARERCRAEARLIKAKIIYKVYQHQPLSSAERKYKSEWLKAIKKSGKCLLDECLVPEKPTNLTIDCLSADDMFTLNSVPKVHLTRETHGKFALNDLCVELSQIIDHKTVRNVELSCLESELQ